MILKTLEVLGSQHGYGIARRIEQTSGDALSVNYGTLYPALLKLEQEGYVSSEWGVSDNNRRAKYYKLTRAGRRQLAEEAREWERTTAILARFFAPAEGAGGTRGGCAARWRAWPGFSGGAGATGSWRRNWRRISRCRLKRTCGPG